ncbi:hypothetical protein [Bosea sp. (in: a-proteobacteria)]|jgi:fucose permease|uniref:hypothetical protein n=1 Tax=Bosea sp. (in: a-proteobacteria) TaxID=1871050 RepID=UPI003F6E7865
MYSSDASRVRVASAWHARVFTGAYSIFGVAAPVRIDRWFYAVTIVLALVFLAIAGLVCLVINAATLPFGVFVEPVWRRNPRFRLLRLPGGLPLLVVASLILGLYTGYRHVLAFGPAMTFGGAAFTLILGVVCFAVVIAFNEIRQRGTRPR